MYTKKQLSDLIKTWDTSTKMAEDVRGSAKDLEWAYTMQDRLRKPHRVELSIRMTLASNNLKEPICSEAQLSNKMLLYDTVSSKETLQLAKEILDKRTCYLEAEPELAHVAVSLLNAHYLEEYMEEHGHEAPELGIEPQYAFMTSEE